MRKPFLALLLLFVFGGCSSYINTKYDSPWTSNTTTLKTTLRSLNLREPKKDLIENVKNSDYRFMGVCLYYCYAPGLENQDTDLVEKRGLRILEGTSDNIEGDQHMKLIGTAMRYAEEYNQGLLEMIKSNTIP
jgi:hypothetical protein